ncbi:MAG: ribonuclease Y [Anaerolineae bacterium]
MFGSNFAMMVILGIGFGALGLGILIGYLIRRYLIESRIKSAEAEAARLLAEAEAQRKDMLLQAQKEVMRLHDELEEEARQRRAELRRQEERLQKRQETLDRRLENIENRERALNKRQSALDRRANEIEQLHAEQLAELQRIAGLTQEQAIQLLLQRVEQDARQDMARIIREVEAEARAEGERRARKIIALAMQRIASDQVAETTVSAVPLPNDEIKGRIIGRQGRNIRTFENATGIDVIVDDSPETIILSGFDPVRREVARVAMNKLIMDGRIHPGRIEKVVEMAQEEVEKEIVEAGEQAVLEAGVPGLHPELVKLIGRLKYRTSYGQNQYQHALECAHIAGILAAELGADVRLAKTGALLHDIGKAVDHQMEGPHAAIGAELAKRYGVSQQVVDIIAAHHQEVETDSLEAIIVSIADAISGSRPGARRESLESYVKRITALEEVANSFKGVAESFAIQAGREIRILVKPEEVDDYTAIMLAKDIARKVEETLEYPGQIKVTVIRETRAVDYAK